MTKIAVYPGSFDPPHYGHINVLQQATNIFDKVIILITDNPAKQAFISSEDKYSLWFDIIEKYNLLREVEVCFNPQQLTVDWMRNRNLTYMVRGVRNSRDFDEEMTLYTVNKNLNLNIKTIFIPANNNTISSSIIRQLVKYKVEDSKLELYTPICVRDLLRKKFYVQS